MIREVIRKISQDKTTSKKVSHTINNFLISGNCQMKMCISNSVSPASPIKEIIKER